MAEKEILKRFYKAVNFEEVYPVPVAFWSVAPWMPSLVGVKCLDYYNNTDIKVAVISQVQKMFPEAMLLPGFQPDYGVVVEASAFGAHIQWMDDDAPFAHPCLIEAKDINEIKQINPNEDGLMPRVLKEWQYMQKIVDPYFKKEYEYMDGVVYCVGPAEIAALLRGYDKFFMDFYENPELCHKLLDIVSEGVIMWIKAQEKLVGSIRRLCLVDHISTQLPPRFYNEFFHPYIQRVFNEFKKAEIRVWHNEGRSSHVYEKIVDLGCNVYNFGADPIEEIKEKTMGRICLMGSLHPVQVVQRRNYETVYEEAVKALRLGSKGGGFLLSAAGGLAPMTPPGNIQAMMQASLDFNEKEIVTQMIV